MADNKKRMSKDKELTNLFESLRAVPKRDDASAQKGKAQFLQLAENIRAQRFGEYSASEVSRPQNWLSRSGLLITRAAVAGLIAFIALFSVISVTAAAAKESLPGDTLYSVKLAYEDFLLLITPSESQQLGWHIRFASNRLEELMTLMPNEQTEGIDAANTNLIDHINSANSLLASSTDQEPSSENMLAYFELMSSYQTFIDMTNTDDDSADEVDAGSDDETDSAPDEDTSSDIDEGDDGKDNEGDDNSGDSDKEDGEDSSDDGDEKDESDEEEESSSDSEESSSEDDTECAESDESDDTDHEESDDSDSSHDEPISEACS